MPVPAETQSLARSTPTPSQTAGPFVSIGTEWAATGLMVPESSPGPSRLLAVSSTVPGQPVTDAMLEFWQAGPDGGFPAEPGKGQWTRLYPRPYRPGGPVPPGDAAARAGARRRRPATGTPYRRVHFRQRAAAEAGDAGLLLRPGGAQRH